MTDTAIPPVLLIMGPTATGKTELAMALHDALQADILSVDSAQVYRGMDIGTAKPDPALLARCPHHLIDIADPVEPYSAGRFVNDARRQIVSSLERGRLPVLVGGTMLYFRVLQDGIASLPSADEGIRRALDAEAQRSGWPALHARLASIDPEAASRIEKNDAQRIQRALEVYEITGTTISELQRRAAPNEDPWRYLKIGLWPADRAALHASIETRFRRMIDAGLVDEVARLHDRADLTPDLPSIRAVGYRQLWRYLDGESSLDEAIEAAVVATRQLAKRQMTWMRRELDLHLLEVPADGLTERCIDLITG